MPPGVRPDTLDGATYVGLIPFRMVGAGFGRGRPSRGWDRSSRPTCGSTPSTRRGAAGSCSSASTPIARRSSPVPERASASPTAGRGCATTARRRRRRPHLRRPAALAGRAARPATSSSAPAAARETTELDHFLSARWGLHSALAGVARSTSPTGTSRGRCTTPRSSRSDDGLMASVGLPGLADAPARPRGLQPRRAHRLRVPGGRASRARPVSRPRPA